MPRRCSRHRRDGQTTAQERGELASSDRRPASWPVDTAALSGRCDPCGQCDGFPQLAAGHQGDRSDGSAEAITRRTVHSLP